MANYTVSNLVKAQIHLNGGLGSNDKRYRIPAVFMLMIRGAERFFPNYKQLKTANNRVVETDYFLNTSGALGVGGESHDHTGTKGDSGTLTLAWQAYDSTFSITLKQADNSTWEWQEKFNNELENAFISFANGLDAVAGTYLFTNRSGVVPGIGKGTFNGANDTYEIPVANKEEGITITKVVADVHKYQGSQLAIVCDSYSYTEFLRQAANGATNATNTSFQFLGTYFVHDPSLGARAIALDATYNIGYWLAVPEDTVVVADWIPPQNVKSVETKVNTYGSFTSPIDKLKYAFHSYESRVDGTATNGQLQDVSTEAQLFISLSFNHAPSSTANETPIMAFAVKA